MNKRQYNSEEQIFKWISQSQKVNEGIEDVKYQGLIAHLEHLQLFSIEKKASVNVLVIGGGECRVELKIISQLGLSNINLYAYDIIKPIITEDGICESIQWLPELFSTKTTMPTQFDVLICLGSSRYFQNALDYYALMFRYLNNNALVIIDFHNLPPIRQAITKIMGDWLRESWQDSSEKTITSLIELAKVSSALSHQLKECRTSFSHDAVQIGIQAGEFGLQQFIYESIFPFWYRDGFSDTEVAAQLAWSFMCTSYDNPMDKIKQFSSLNNLIVEDVFDIYSDTHVLIARYKV